MIDKDRINNTMGKMAHHLATHNNILISVSGGSDSDIIVHIIATYFRDMLPKIHFVFADTGLEYRATKDHLVYLEEHYSITIERIRGKSVVWAVRNYGVPVQRKHFSRLCDNYRKGLPSGIKWRNGGYAKEGMLGKATQFSCRPSERELADAIKERNIKVSSKCCDVSKKKPMLKYSKEHNIDLDITGERRAEGGQRAVSHHDCFEPNTSHGFDKYMPLFFWDDETKAYYKESEGIRYSDCYEKWGMKRTGCVGCPFNSRCGEDLQMIYKFEPQLFKACMKVFGESYRLTDEFHMHRKQFLDWYYGEAVDENQMNMWGDDNVKD